MVTAPIAEPALTTALIATDAEATPSSTTYRAPGRRPKRRSSQAHPTARRNCPPTVRPQVDIEAAMKQHADTVWRVCMLHCAQQPDAQDAFQNTFLNYALADTARFTSEEHRKAWLIRTAVNACTDLWRSQQRRTQFQAAPETLEIAPDPHPGEHPGSVTSDVIDAMRRLPDPPRTPLYLALYEGYTAPEIARHLGASVNTVYTWISRGKAKLREQLQ